MRDALSTSGLGAFRGYEIEVPQLGGRDSYSTGDIWVTVYRGDAVQQGGDVGVAAPCATSRRERSSPYPFDGEDRARLSLVPPVSPGPSV